MLIDTHAHIHFDDYTGKVDAVLTSARTAGVDKIICVGVNDDDSVRALTLASSHGLPAGKIGLTGGSSFVPRLYATAGLHPHNANRGQMVLDRIADLARTSNSELRTPIVAIGECGLDFYRNLSSRAEQEAAFRFQINLALELKLPMIWHVRQAFDEFFQVVDQYPGIQGIVHCFTSNQSNMEKALERGFYVAFNGIMTFTKDAEQLAAAKACPLDRMVLETDCPFLSPSPLRGKVNEPANLKITAEFLAELHGEDYDKFAAQTSQNAIKLLRL